MCGITGFFNFNGINGDSLRLVEKMADSLIHRGPDDKGVFSDNYVALGHRRLSVIDVKNGKQPMFDANKTVAVVYNGEIYNFQNLRKELEESGFSFYTESDTEVLINSYLKWGENFVEKLNGMFAFALYDKLKKTLYLFRDRLGVKPLFYTFYNNTIIFSSEPKAIFFFPVPKEINKKALSHYLTSHNINIGEETLYKNIFMLPPATFLKYNENGLKKATYWNMSFIDEDYEEEFYLSEIKKRLKDSTLMRLVSDVPIGAYLSGGVDSSILVSIITEKAKGRFKTFSIGLDIDGFNEFEYSNMLNEFLNIEHYNHFFDNSKYFKLNSELIDKKDFPLNVPNEILLFELSKKLKEQVTVVLSGEGADELFGGYGYFLRSVHDFCKIFILNRCPDFYNENVRYFAEESLQRLYKSTELCSVEEFLYKVYSVFDLNEKNFIFNFKTNDDFILEHFSSVLNSCEKTSYYDKFLYFLETYHLQGLLLRNDNATMSASVECRVPFTDYKFVEFAFNIPFKYKLKWKNDKSQIDAIVSNASEISEKYDISKYILKKSFKGTVPEKILSRNKFSFPVPLNEWFNGEFSYVIRETFNDKNSLFYEYFNYENISDFIKAPFYGKKGLKVWMLLNLKTWMDKIA